MKNKKADGTGNFLKFLGVIFLILIIFKVSTKLCENGVTCDIPQTQPNLQNNNTPVINASDIAKPDNTPFNQLETSN